MRLTYCHNATLGRRDFYRQLCVALGLSPARLAGEAAGQHLHPMFVSVVTPTLDEQDELPHRASELLRQEPPWEWIVADGGSHDRTIAIAEQLGARVVRARRGRGPQLKAGVAASRGKALVFLHADTRLPAQALAAVRRVLADEHVAGGNFTLRFGEGTRADRLFGAWYALQGKLFRVFYGDSVIFARASALERAGGFPEDPLFEDVGLVDRLRRTGMLVTLAPVVTTSSRRYRDHPVRAVAVWAALLALHRVGVPTQTLARLYPPARERRASPDAPEDGACARAR